MKQNMTRREFLRLSASVTGVLLTACGGGSTPATTGEGAAATAEPAVAVAEPTVAVAETAAAEVTQAAGQASTAQLLCWDGFEGESAVIDRLVAEFNEANPEIKIVREAQPQMRDILRTALDAGQGPDIMYYDTGPGFAGVLARAGLLHPLDEAYDQYGWNERILPIASERTTFDGKVYGIGHALEIVGVFYNKRIFQEQGLSEPKTHEEFLQIASKLKGAGLIPIGFSNQEKWEAGHTFSVFAGNIAGKQKLEQAISGEVPWNDPDFVQAIQIPFVEMQQAGYFIPEINAVTYDDWNSLFFNGQAATSLTGTWQIQTYSNKETMADPVGFFLYPSVQGKPIAPPSGLGSGYFVSSKTKSANAAYKFLDFLFSKGTAKTWIEELNIIPPIQLNPDEYNTSELMSFTLQALQREADKMGYNIDVLTPENFNTVMFDGFQEVLGGTKTAQQQADDLQKAMEEAKKDGKVLDITS